MFDLEKPAKENAKEMKDLEVKMKELEVNTGKEIKDSERVIVFHFCNLQTAVISVLASSSNRRPDEIADSLRREKHSESLHCY